MGKRKDILKYFDKEMLSILGETMLQLKGNTTNVIFC